MTHPVNRLRLTLVTALGAILVGALFQWSSYETSNSGRIPVVDTDARTQSIVTAAKRPAKDADSESEVSRRFMQGVTMLHAMEYEHAITAFHSVLEILPNLPEAHVNMGFAMLGLSQLEPAIDFFRGAISLRPSQANAYYGLAVAYDELGQRHAAIEAMKMFIHLSPPNDPFVRKATAALWEWNAVKPEDRGRDFPEASLPN